MTRTIPEPASPNFRTTSAGGNLTHDRFRVHQAYKRGMSSVESGFEPGDFRLQGWGLTAWSPQPRILYLISFPWWGFLNNFVHSQANIKFEGYSKSHCRIFIR
ncbi:hypothetical protein AVEN_16071-1 [Araneus ventricosus]|uniref:Uncharacterized protein n=1 Tax=Araneus ventricosus TaxID=182803 RepID=A0A4Y2RJV2_ARAVE|nr:hypothetical protein AVEN_16071-1 [Araneus ventricosus]